MVGDEHPQVIAIILSVLEDETAVMSSFFASGDSAGGHLAVALLDTVQPNAMAELESVMAKQFAQSTTTLCRSGWREGGPQTLWQDQAVY